MEEIFAEFVFAIYDHMHKNEENTAFPFFSHGKNIQKLDTIKTRDTSKMNNRLNNR